MSKEDIKYFTKEILGGIVIIAIGVAMIYFGCLFS